MTRLLLAYLDDGDRSHRRIILDTWLVERESSRKSGGPSTIPDTTR
jgi:hypothetical protein